MTILPTLYKSHLNRQLTSSWSHPNFFYPLIMKSFVTVFSFSFLFLCLTSQITSTWITGAHNQAQPAPHIGSGNTPFAIEQSPGGPAGHHNAPPGLGMMQCKGCNQEFSQEGFLDHLFSDNCKSIFC